MQQRANAVTNSAGAPLRFNLSLSLSTLLKGQSEGLTCMCQCHPSYLGIFKSGPVQLSFHLLRWLLIESGSHSLRFTQHFPPISSDFLRFPPISSDFLRFLSISLARSFRPAGNGALLLHFVSFRFVTWIQRCSWPTWAYSLRKATLTLPNISNIDQNNNNNNNNNSSSSSSSSSNNNNKKELHFVCPIQSVQFFIHLIILCELTRSTELNAAGRFNCRGDSPQTQRR